MNADNMSLQEVYEVYAGLEERRRWLCERIRRSPGMGYWASALESCEAMRVQAENILLERQAVCMALSMMFHRLNGIS